MSEAVECPNCGSLKSRVVDARPRTDPIPHFFRRRCCCLCGGRYTRRLFHDNISFHSFIDASRFSGGERAVVKHLVAKMLDTGGGGRAGGEHTAARRLPGGGEGAPRRC